MSRNEYLVRDEEIYISLDTRATLKYALRDDQLCTFICPSLACVVMVSVDSVDVQLKKKQGKLVLL
jgi:hypothetical protein